MTDETNPDLEPADDLGTPPRGLVLDDEHERYDYLAADGTTVVTVVTFADGTSLKAWTVDGGETYTTRAVKADGSASLKSTSTGLTAEQVSDLVDASAEAKAVSA